MAKIQPRFHPQLLYSSNYAPPRPNQISFMKLEHQVTSLEISKRLKELGVKYESLFDWYDVGNDVYYLGSNTDAANNAKDYSNSTAIGYEQRIISAFTCAELGEMLPLTINGVYMSIFREKGLESWDVAYGTFDKQNIWEQAETLADAMGKMLIYLIENGLCPSQSKT